MTMELIKKEGACFSRLIKCGCCHERLSGGQSS